MAHIAGNTSVTASGGVATFGSAILATAGTYTLTAAGTELTSVTSGSFAIAVGPAAKLVFGQQPSNATASGGVATFSGAVIDKAGTYSLTASASGLTSATSGSFAITAGVPDSSHSTLVARPTSVPADGTSTAMLTLMLADAHGNPVGSQTVSLTVSGSNNTLTPAGGSTNASGVFTATLASTTTQDKTVTATGGNVLLSTPVSFTSLGCTSTLLLPGLPLLLATGSNPWSVTTGDFNRDGRPDLAITSASNTVSVLLGTGNGTFAAPVNYATGADPVSGVTDRATKYKAKAAIDTFVVRFGDTLSVLLVWVGVHEIGMRVRDLAFVNFGLVAVWIVVAIGIAREHKKISRDKPAPVPAVA